jgi:hypothetical protein
MDIGRHRGSAPIATQEEYEPGLAFLHKPFTPSVLAERVRAVLDGAG